MTGVHEGGAEIVQAVGTNARSARNVQPGGPERERVRRDRRHFPHDFRQPHVAERFVAHSFVGVDPRSVVPAGKARRENAAIGLQDRSAHYGTVVADGLCRQLLEEEMVDALDGGVDHDR